MPKTLTKSDLIDAIAKNADIPKTKADAALGALVNTVVTNVKKGHTVRVSGLGTWKRQSRKARTARNPQTGAAVKVPATKVPKFTAAAGFKDEVGGKKKQQQQQSAKKSSGGRKTSSTRKKR